MKAPNASLVRQNTRLSIRDGISKISKNRAQSRPLTQKIPVSRDDIECYEMILALVEAPETTPLSPTLLAKQVKSYCDESSVMTRLYKKELGQATGLYFDLLIATSILLTRYRGKQTITTADVKAAADILSLL